MTREQIETLNTDVLVGFTDKRGHAWHYRAGLQGDEPNHYPGAIPVDDVLRRLFSWRPIEADVILRFPDGKRTRTVNFENRKGYVRSDNFGPLGVFSRQGYVIHEYPDWLVKTVATILDDDLQIGSAGLLRGGALAWVQVEVPDSIETPEGVTFRPNLLATTSMDGSIATTFKRTITNVVCDNTHHAALGEAGETFKVRHTSRSLNRISDAREALGIVYSTADEFAAEVAALSDTKVTDLQWRRFLDAYAPVKGSDSKRGQTIATDKQAALSRLWTSDERVAPWNGTAWGVVAAVNTFTHHEGVVRNVSRVERNMERAATGKVAALDLGTLSTLDDVTKGKVQRSLDKARVALAQRRAAVTIA